MRKLNIVGIIKINKAINLCVYSVKPLGIMLNLSTQKQPSCKKIVWPMQKGQHEKAVKSKVADPEVAVMVCRIMAKFLIQVNLWCLL